MTTPVESAAPLVTLVCPRCRASGKSVPLLALPADGLLPPTALATACHRCDFAPRKTPGGAPSLAPDPSPGAVYYESPETLRQYLALHHAPGGLSGAHDGDPDRGPVTDLLADILGERAPRPGERFPHALRAWWRPRPRAAALDIGCAVGGMTLALARDHGIAVGLDRSERFVDAAGEVASLGHARTSIQVEGEITREIDVPLAALDVTGPAAARARFLAGDALALPFDDAAFGTVIALNLVDRVPDPARALSEAGRVTAPGGLLLISSPFTWLAEYAPRERWLGGTRTEAGAVRRGEEGVVAALGPRFALERLDSLPFYIPHHARSGQLGLARCLLFRRID